MHEQIPKFMQDFWSQQVQPSQPSPPPPGQSFYDTTGCYNPYAPDTSFFNLDNPGPEFVPETQPPPPPRTGFKSRGKKTAVRKKATASAPVDDEDETADPKEKKKAVRQEWKEHEDVALIQIFMQLSEDSIQGTNRSYTRMFQDVWKAWMQAIEDNHPFKGLTKRTADSLRGRWGRLKEEVNYLASCYDEAKRMIGGSSGYNEDDVVQQARDFHGKKYCSRSSAFACWEAMREYPQWSEYLNQSWEQVPKSRIISNQRARTEDVEMEDGSGGSGSKRPAPSDDTSAARSKRPDGRDKAKAALKGTSSDSSAMDGLNSSFSTMNTIEEKRLEVKLKKIEERKLEAAKRFEIQERKLQLEEKRAEEDRRHREKKSADTNKLAETQAQTLRWNKVQTMRELQNNINNLNPIELDILQQLKAEFGYN